MKPKRSANAMSSGSAPAYSGVPLAPLPSAAGGGFIAPQRWRSFSSAIPWTILSWTIGNSLFCSSGRQREISSNSTDSASQIVAGVCRYTRRPLSGTGKPTRSSKFRSDAL